MSGTTTSDLLQRTTELVQALDELINTDTAQALPEVAEQLGATEILITGIDALVSMLRELVKGLDDLKDNLLAIGGLLGLLEPLVGALGRMIGGTGDELADYGLGGVVQVTDPIADGFEKAEKALQVAGNLSVDPQLYEKLLAELDRLADSFEDLKVTAADSAGAGDGEDDTEAAA